MSFQHFRLGELALHQPLPPHLTQHHQQPVPSTSTFSAHPFPAQPQKPPTSTSPTKQPYGSGDSDDGYTLIFPNIQAFHEWRNAEEERQMVEFVKGDTHGSKAVPPRFKDHTKLVCARHSRSGRKKYVKKHPDRVRKVPSRKLEGVGCPASISYKTYFDTEEVRACYISQHSHEIGLANLPFTRRGRKAAVQQEKERRKSAPTGDDSATSPGPPADNDDASASIPGPAPTAQPVPSYTTSVSMLAPLPPAQPTYQPQPPPPQPYGYPAPVASAPVHPYAHAAAQGFPQERWDNMVTLFNSVREHARGFDYPLASVTALETVLIRLYLESPVGVGVPASGPVVMQNGISRQPPPPPQPQQAGAVATSQANAGSASGHVGTTSNGASADDSS